MRVSWKGGIATVAAAGMLVVGVDYVSFAATGHSLILGRFNTTTKPTTLSNQGAGPALRLKTSANNIPPLAVNSSRKVRKLNADQVDGRDAAQLSTRVLTYRAGARAEVFQGFAIWDVPLDPGIYQASFRSVIVPNRVDQTAPAEMICGVVDVTHFGGPRTTVYTADSALYLGNAPAFLSGAETIRITDKDRPAIFCGGNNADSFTLFTPIKASFARVDRRVTRIAQPAQPPAPVRKGLRLLAG